MALALSFWLLPVTVDELPLGESSGFCFLVFTSFVHGFSDSPRLVRTGRSLSDALVFAALSESPHGPDSLRYMMHPEMKRPYPKKSPMKTKPSPDVEIVKSIEMEFDAVLHKLVPVKHVAPRTKDQKSNSGGLPEMPLLSQKTNSDLKEIIWKFEKEKRTRKPGLSESKNFQTGRFKHGTHPFASEYKTNPAKLDPSWTGILDDSDKSNFLKFYVKNWKKGARSPVPKKFLTNHSKGQIADLYFY